MNSTRTWFPLTRVVPVSAPVMAATKTKKVPIDPLTGPKQALAGRVVTMDDAFTVRLDGIVYIDQGGIVAVNDRGQPAPVGFDGVPVVETGGTLLPGLIELHNHLSYNALPLWSPVPKRFEHRDQWSSHKDYRPMISGPMTVIGEYRGSTGQPALLPALVRYVECKSCSAASPPARASCSPATLASDASTAGSYATSSGPRIPHCPRRRVASPTLTLGMPRAS